LGRGTPDAAGVQHEPDTVVASQSQSARLSSPQTLFVSAQQARHRVAGSAGRRRARSRAPAGYSGRPTAVRTMHLGPTASQQKPAARWRPDQGRASARPLLGQVSARRQRAPDATGDHTASSSKPASSSAHVGASGCTLIRGRLTAAGCHSPTACGAGASVGMTWVSYAVWGEGSNCAAHTDLLGGHPQ